MGYTWDIHGIYMGYTILNGLLCIFFKRSVDMDKDTRTRCWLDLIMTSRGDQTWPNVTKPSAFLEVAKINGERLVLKFIVLNDKWINYDTFLKVALIWFCAASVSLQIIEESFSLRFLVPMVESSPIIFSIWWPCWIGIWRDPNLTESKESLRSYIGHMGGSEVIGVPQSSS